VIEFFKMVFCSHDWDDITLYNNSEDGTFIVNAERCVKCKRTRVKEKK